MNGRDKCELLNEVRQKIAEKNNIEFTVYECTFEGGLHRNLSKMRIRSKIPRR